MSPLLLLLFHFVVLLHHGNRASADAQLRFLNQGCSQYNATNATAFVSNFNRTIADIRSQVIVNASTFATAQSLSSFNPVYTLFQCRDYLSPVDCATCLANAAARIRGCGAANGARVVYDGCFIRYESSAFFDQATLPGNVALCGNNSAGTGGGFAAAAETLMADLSIAVPRIDVFFAAATAGSGTSSVAYGIAQCARTVSAANCMECLRVARENIKGCLPNADARAVDAGCFMRYSNAPFFPANRTLDLAPYLSAGNGSSNKKAIIGGVVGGVVGLLIILCILWFLWIRRSRIRMEGRGRRGDLLGATELRGPMHFPYKDLRAATRNFDEKNKLGEGGFGSVYKGILKNGKTVAVKRLDIGQSRRVNEEFQREVKLITNVHHRHLIRLLGFSSRGSDLLLVYEYMANSSLDKFLFGEKQGSLNWKQRFNIILGMARGLAYLHDEFHVCIIHRDIKSSNVLLDEEFQPKIADFGLARLLPEGQSHLTTGFAGTLGYTAPEYAIHGQLSEKVDAYSFGVVVLEIISGRKANDVKLDPGSQYLLEWAWKLYEKDRSTDLVDDSLKSDEYTAEEMSKVIEIALLCTQSTVAERPAMTEVVVMLLSKYRPEARPTRPIFIDAASKTREEMNTTTSMTTFASDATNSVPQLSIR